MNEQVQREGTVAEEYEFKEEDILISEEIGETK